jgi:hypothetical protein
MDVTKPIFPALPRWVAAVYGFLALVTIPWTIYLGITLPTRHLSTHWDIAWVGLDVTIVAMLVLNAVYSYRESKWLVMSATATTTLLLTDAWFDLVTARSGKAVAATAASAVLIEIPLALLTFIVALRIVNREHITDKNRSPAED